MWKIHCMTVVFLTGINFYLLVKLLHCAEKTNDHNRTSSTEGSSASSIFGWQYPGQQHRPPQLDVQVRGLWKSLQLPEQHRTEEQSSGARSQARSRSGHEDDQPRAAETDAPVDGSALDLLMPLGRWDDSRSFVIRDFAVTGRHFHSTAVSHNVCLATQSSLDRLHWLGESSDHWRGAISLAIYLDDDEVGIFYKVLTHMRRCHSDLLANIAFHVVSAAGQSMTLPAAFSATFASSASSGSSSSKTWTEADDGDEGTSASAAQSTPVNCTGPSEALTWLLKERPSLSAKWESGRPYPQNLMRNVARKGCPSHYVLLLDVDVIPSYNMAESLAEFLDQPSVVAHCTKCAFVVPTYELDYSADFPQNKTQLLTLENQGRAQPFHHKAFRYNQFASNLTR